MDVSDQLSVLVHLSRVDKSVAPAESKLIHYIGALNGMSKHQIDAIINHPQPISNLEGLTEDDRLDYLINTVQLMKVDGQVFKSEIDFCEKIAMKLGYNPGVIAALSQYTYADPEISTSKNYLRDLAKKYLQKK